MTSQRLAQYIDYKEVSYYAFENFIGVSRGGISKAVKKNKNIGSGILENILSHYDDLNPTWLLTGKGSMLLEEVKNIPVYKDQATAPPNVIEINPEAAKTNTLIADVHASAGFGGLMESKTELEQLPSTHLPNAPQGLNVAFQVNGDSMHPTIRHLDFVAGNRINEVSNIRDGHTYIIVDREEGVLCKRIYNLGEDWQIVSDNPIYKPYNREKEYILAFFQAFCRWSYDFRSYHDDVRADIQQLKANTDELKADIESLKNRK